MPPLPTLDPDPRTNGAKVRRLLAGDEPYVDLYRSVVAGPSGQRSHLSVARLRLYGQGSFELRIDDPREGVTAGYAGRAGNRNGRWTFWTEDANGSVWLAGWSDMLSVGCDVVVNGEHAAIGRHDHRRISGGNHRWHRHEPAAVTP